MLTINGRTLNLSTGELTYLGETTLVEAKVLAVFNVLYAGKGQLVSQEALLAQVWGDTNFAPNALQRCIAQLRKHLGDNDKQLLQTFPKKGYRLQPDLAVLPKKPARYRLYVVVAVALLLSIVLFLNVSPVQPSYRLSAIQPVSYGAANEQHGTLRDGQLFYIQRGAATAALVHKDLQAEQSAVLHRAADFYGIPSISPDGNKLAAVAMVVRQNRQKCSQLIWLQLANAGQSSLFDCSPSAVRQLHWVSNNLLLAVSAEHIFAVEPGSNVLGADILPIKLQQISASYWLADQLYVMGLDQQATATLWLFSYKPQSAQLSLIKQTKLSYTPESPAYFSVDQAGTLVQQHNNTVYIYHDLSLYQALPVADFQQLQFTAAAAPGQWLASRVRTDKQVAMLDINSTTLDATPFDEQDAQFQPATTQVAFLSNRSGQQELWLQRGSVIQRLNPGQHVRSFVWQQDGAAIWTLGAEQISKQPLDAQPQQVMPAGDLKVLLQHVQTNAGEFLLALDNAAQLVLIDINRQTAQRLFSGAVHWAQQSNSGQIFLATPSSPTIKLLENGVLTDITALQQQVLQWRFYWRDNQLLFADKQQKILAYDPKQNELKMIGHYSNDFAMATDVQAEPLRLLANTTAAEQAMQVLVKLELR